MSEERLLGPNLSYERGGGRRAVPTMLQMEVTECGAACLGMVLGHYGRWVPLEELRVRCGVSRDGSKAANMLRAARGYGMTAQGYRSEPLRVFDIPFPMIVFWDFNHFVVLEGIKKDKVYLNDPAEGPRVLSMEEFDEGFTGICLGFQPGPEFRRSAKQPGIVSGLRSRLGKARTPLAFAVLATLMLVLPGLAVPTITKTFVDEVLIQSNGEVVAGLLIGLAVAAGMQGLLTWMQQVCLARMETKLSLVTTTRFFWHVVALPMEFFGQRFAGDVASRVASNDQVARMLAGELATNAINMLTMVFFALVMLSYDVLLTLVALFMVLLNLLALRLVSRVRENANRRFLKEQGKLAGTSINGVRMIETLKANGSEDDFFARWSGIHANSLVAQQQLGLYTNLLGVVPPMLASLTTVAILGVGGLRVLEGALTIGGLVAFQTLAQRLAEPITGLVQFGANLQTAKGDIARLDDVLKYKPSPRVVQTLREEQSEALPRARGHVVIEGITYGYNMQEPPLIKDFSLTVQPGQRVALVGGSGSGKSTIARLVCGLLTPWAGTVRVDGYDLKEISSGHFAELVSYVDQEVVLFQATVQDNIALWDATIPEYDLTQALRDASIHDVVMARPGKLMAEVGENGLNFSGGQRQRLEIARALASSSPVLVLDEATAALDPVTELEIDNRLRRRGVTCLIIAHRVSTIRDADEIIVLERGNIVQRGMHDDLIKQKGTYRDLITAS